jgi:hypothetical protein
MKVKYVGEHPTRFGSRLVNAGDELYLEDSEANEALSSGRFALADEPEPKKKAKTKTKKSTDTTEEES